MILVDFTNALSHREIPPPIVRCDQYLGYIMDRLTLAVREAVGDPYGVSRFSDEGTVYEIRDNMSILVCFDVFMTLDQAKDTFLRLVYSCADACRRWGKMPCSISCEEELLFEGQLINNNTKNKVVITFQSLCQPKP